MKSFSSMDASTREQWISTAEETAATPPGSQLDGRLADRSGQKALALDYQSQTLEHFEPLVRRVFARVKSLEGGA